MNNNETMQMGNILRQIIKVLFLAALAACNAPQEGNGSTEITQTAAPDQDWVIFTREQAEEMGLGSWLVESDGFWTPSENDILALEESITEYLSQNSDNFSWQPAARQRLDEYQRQYIGLERGGE